MYVSAEMLTTIISLATLLIAFASGFGWLIQRVDGVEHKLGQRIDGVEHKLGQRIDGVEQKLTKRIDDVERKLTEKIDAQGREITEIKIEIARLEGPRPRLIPLR